MLPASFDDGDGNGLLRAPAQGAIASLPAGFTTRFALTASSLGVTDAVYAFGLYLREAYSLQRSPIAADPLRTTLSYWLVAVLPSLLSLFLMGCGGLCMHFYDYL